MGYVGADVYYHREIEPELRRALEQFPAVLITGPRQAGKSTLLLHCLEGYTYATLDDPELRALAVRDPELFLSTYSTPLIIDEIQYAPGLLPYLKLRIDRNRHSYGQYVLTGSQTFQLMQGVSETLAGRVGIFQLYPFNWREIERIPGFAESSHDAKRMMSQTVQGFYPEFFHTPGLDWNRWYGSYLSTYLERDVRNVKAISDLSRFQTFLSLLATRVGSLLNLTEIGKECGVSAPTAKDWLAILQATYVVYLLKPYFRNHSKRLVKSPKLYFVDTGLLCYLLGIDSGSRFLRAAERDNIFENMVVMDALKRAATSAQREEFYFYRTLKGDEIDLLILRGGNLHANEIKFSKAITKSMADALVRFRTEHEDARCHILSLREEPLALTPEISSLHWSQAES